MEEEFKIIDSSKLQLQSIKNYMTCLGYSWFNLDRVFYSPYYTNRGRNVVSLRVAQLAHNGFFTDWHGVGFHRDSLFGNIPVEWWQEANKAKIVHSTFLQLHKK